MIHVQLPSPEIKTVPAAATPLAAAPASHQRRLYRQLANLRDRHHVGIEVLLGLTTEKRTEVAATAAAELKVELEMMRGLIVSIEETIEDFEQQS